MQSVNTYTVPGKPEITEGREVDDNVAVNQGNRFKNFEGNIGKIPQNLSTQKTNNPERTATELHAPTAFNRSRLNMDKALDTLWEIEYCIQDKDAQEQLGLKTESGFWGTLKNAFCKFLGCFCNAVKENRTNALNQQIEDVLEKICKNEDFYEKVLLPVMYDGDINEELKTACFNLFKDKEKLFSDLENPNAHITYNILRDYKDEINNGKLFGKDVCAQWLSPLMNEGNATDEIKLKLYALFDNNPDIQDKLFKSLKEPPKEIREQFWERHGEKILDGSLMKKFFGIQTPVTKMSKAQWESCKGNPLTEMLCIELENNEKLT